MLGIDSDRVIDFSASINPLGAPPGVWDAMQGIDLATYPDRLCTALRGKLAQKLNVEPAVNCLIDILRDRIGEGIGYKANGRCSCRSRSSCVGFGHSTSA